MKSYGKELIIDLHNCNASRFNRKALKIYFKGLCKLIEMQPAKLVFWDDVGVAEEEKQTQAHTKGTSAVQFILTSNITVHTLDLLGNVYVNIFSCKNFDTISAGNYTEAFFGGKLVHHEEINRL